MPNGIPRVFLGSASETLDEVKVVKERLKSSADIVAWNDESVFPPNQYLLDTLLGLSKSFDFAILIFGQDDEVISRGQKFAAPRDNVIFELGLFMSQLDRPRTFVIRPSGNGQYKILSDLGGLTLISYDPPARTNPRKPLTVAEQKRRILYLQGALEKACSSIAAVLTNHGRRKSPPAGADLGPENVLAVGDKLFREIESLQSSGGRTTVCNIAHDMGVTWPLVKSRLVDQEEFSHVHWRTLMIDPDAPAVRKLAGAGISTRVAASRIREIRWADESLQRALRERSVKFECRIYDDIPTSHGFMLNTDALFLTMSKRQRNGKLESSSSPYWIFRRDDEAKQLSHPIEAFQSWFDYTWKRSQKVR